MRKSQLLSLLKQTIFVLLYLCLTAVLPTVSQAQQQTAGDLFPIYRDGKLGFIDKTGKIVIQPQYNAGDGFSDGLARVLVGDKTVFIAPSGQVVLQPEFDSVQNFSEGLAVVNTGEVVDTHTRIAIKKGKWGYINQKGRLIIPLRFTHADAFSEGLAAVNHGDRSGFIDRRGKMVFEFPFDASFGFQEGFALVRQNKDQSFYFLDKTGKRLTTPAIEDARPFSEGLAAVRIGGKWGYIDKAGKVVIEPQFIEAGDFREGLAPAEVPVDIDQEKPCVTSPEGSSYRVSKKYGYIDKTGKMVVPPLFESAGPFVDGLANVHNCEQASFVDMTGKTIITSQFQYAMPFWNGLAEVEIGDSTGLRRGYIDRTGKFIWQPTK